MVDKDFWELTGEEPVADMIKINTIFKEQMEMYKDNKNILLNLRKAYQVAMDEVFENDIKPSLDMLIKKLDEIYSDINTRFNAELWEKTFQNSLFENTFVFGYVRNEIIAYLLYHEYISVQIWKIIDNKLNIMRDYNEIKAVFPITFMQRIKRVLNDETLFEYERVRALNDAAVNPDEYIQDLFELADMVEFGESDTEIELQLEKMRKHGFYHICADAEYLNYLVKFEKGEEKVEQLCDKLSDDDNIYVQACVGNALWYLGRYDEADSVWQKILEVIPDYYKALMGHARYLFENEYYDQAKDYVFSAIEAAGERDDALKLLSDINDVVMKNYLDMYEENPDNLYDGIQYAWCLCQSGRWDEAIDFLLDMEDDESISYDINMLLGRAYFSKDDFKNAIPYLQKWIKQIMLLPCDGSEDYKDKMERYPGALAIMSECYREIGDIDKAIYFMEQSMHAYDDKDCDKLKAMTRLADFYNDAGMYEQAYNISGQVIERDEGYVWAYFAHQIAAFETYNTPAVISDYSALTNFSPTSVEPYIYAAKVYMYNNMYDDMEMVLERAESNGVSAPQFDIMRYIIAAARAELCDMSDIEEDFDMCAAKRDLRDETKLVSRFYMTIENRYRNAGLFEDAIEYIDRVISVEPENPYHKWEKADLYFRNNEDAQALEIYKTISADLKDNTSFLCDYAFCMQYNDMWEESAAILNEVLKTENTGMADAYMMRYYKNLYNDSDAREHYEKARKHIDRQIEKTPDNMFAIRERMFLQMIVEDSEGIDTAIQDCLTLMEAEYGSEVELKKQLADLYIKKGEPQKAIDELESVAKCDGESEPGFSVYKLAAKAYERMNRRDMAEEIFKRAYRRTKDSYYIKEIADCCTANGNYRGAIRWYKKYVALGDEGFNCSVALARVYLLNKSRISAERIYKKIFAHFGKQTQNAARRAAWQIFNYLFDVERAAEYMCKTIKYTPKECMIDPYGALALFYRYMNDDKKACEYAKKMFDVMTEGYSGDLEKYLDVTYGLRDRLDNAVLYYIGLGEFDKAEEYINQMLCSNTVCAWCSEPCCTDAYIRLAQLKIVQGDFNGMRNVCEELLEKDYNNPQAKVYLEKIEELKKQYENYR